MAYINNPMNEIILKIVYYGPALSGKTTNLKQIYQNSAFKKRGRLTCIATDTERTILFDYLQIEYRKIGKYIVLLDIYTVPGISFYYSLRKLVLKGVDGVVFVADIQRGMFASNISLFNNLKEDLLYHEISIDSIPIIFQYNKCDLNYLVSENELNEELNVNHNPYFLASAAKGENVIPCLQAVAEKSIKNLLNKIRISAKKNAYIPTSIPQIFGDIQYKDYEEIKENISDTSIYLEREDFNALNKIKMDFWQTQNVKCICSKCRNSKKYYEFNIKRIMDAEVRNVKALTCMESFELVKLNELGRVLKDKSVENETKACESIYERLYVNGREYLLTAIKYDPTREKRLIKEFGYLYNLGSSLENEKIEWKSRESQLNWRNNIWRVLSARNLFPIQSVPKSIFGKIELSSHFFEDETMRVNRDEMNELLGLQKDAEYVPSEEITFENRNYGRNGESVIQNNIKGIIQKPVSASSQSESKKKSDSLDEITSAIQGVGHAQNRGEILETAFMELLKHFFQLSDEGGNFVLEKARRQKGSYQYGYDLQFIYKSKGDKKVQILFECKNYTAPVKLRDIADKLDAVKANYLNVEIDHWILVSPFANVSNELNNILEIWEKYQEYPFRVQIWTPETRVKDFFGLLPSVYDFFFRIPDTHEHPTTWSKEKRKQVIEVWKQKLLPPLRLPKGWEEYLRNPQKLKLSSESKELENLYHDHVTLNCKDETGALIHGKTLEDKVLEWLEKPIDKNPTLILLGEFGDGKTVFTYILTRKLAEKYLQSPSISWLPIRLCLKDFSIENVNTSRDILRRRLEDFGADINGWNDLKNSNTKILAILDGFDEMSKKLDHKTILSNIKRIIECYNNEFSGIKIIITSRKHFFENQDNKSQLLNRIGNPQLLHIAPIDRKTTENHLQAFAKKLRAEENFKKLRNCHDPIGLASKPLFLEMVKLSLKKLPYEDLNELILYDTYSRDCLERKSEYLEDENLHLTPTAIINSMFKILEEIAAKLHQTEDEYVFLSELKAQQSIIKCLWMMSDPLYEGALDDTYEDETARVAVRSLLRRVDIGELPEGKQWPVDFCHRSMREYFVARAVCQMLQNNQRDLEPFLKKCYLNREIVFFASKLMKRVEFDFEDDLLQMKNKAKREVRKENKNTGFLGCNAINLLYQWKGILPKKDWSGLILDGVDLAGADLSGKDFSNSSLQYANLDSVNFSNSNFSSCDFTGVRLEESSPVKSIAVSPDENIYALYDNGALCEWNYKRARVPSATKLAVFNVNEDNKIIAYPGPDILILKNGELVFFDKIDSLIKEKAIFKIKSNIKLIKASYGTILMLESSEKHNILRLIDLDKPEVLQSLYIGSSVICDHLGIDAFVFSSGKKEIQIYDLSSQNREAMLISFSDDVTCLKSFQSGKFEDKYLIAVGLESGDIHLWQITSSDWEVKPLIEYKAHDKAVSDIAFIDEHQIVSGGFDKKLLLAEIVDISERKWKSKDLAINLKCQGMIIQDIIPIEKQRILKKLIERSTRSHA